MNYPDWLTKQMLLGVRRFDMDSFLVALEGWRRGLELTFYYDPSRVTDLKLTGYNQIGKAFSLASDERTHYFYRSRGDKVTNEAAEAGTDKARAKQLLQQAGIPTPEGFSFNRDADIEETIQKAVQLGFPLVLKPTHGSLGKGVHTNIQTEEGLRSCIEQVFSDYDYNEFLIERYIEGDDVRVYVIEDELVCATKRIPANITGDGVHSISELIDQKNEIRKENPHASTRLIKKDEELESYLKKQNLTLDSVPNQGETIYVKGQSNISAGGDSVDISDHITDEIKKVAIQAVEAIPGLYQAGIDLIVSKNDVYVLEVNTTAGISIHAFPLKGQPRNVAEKIIDYYFPETKGKAVSKKIYFNYKNVLKLLRSHELDKLQIADAPEGEIYAKRYVISGKVQRVGYRKWVQRQATGKGLHGYTRNLKNGKVVVVVGSTDKQLVDDFKQICYEGPERAKVTDIKEYVWNHQIRVGFEIRKTR